MKCAYFFEEMIEIRQVPIGRMVVERGEPAGQLRDRVLDHRVVRNGLQPIEDVHHREQLLAELHQQRAGGALAVFRQRDFDLQRAKQKNAINY